MKDVLKYKNFIATVHYSTEDEVFHGKITGIGDSITFEGDTVVDLKTAFEEAVNDYLNICKQIKKDPHKSFKGSFNVRIKPELHKKAAFKSLELGISLNQFVEKAISKLISGHSSPSHQA
jgi:predicted HicB family RNase H-like nuclease